MSLVRSLVAATAVGGLVIACGSSTASVFDPADNDAGQEAGPTADTGPAPGSLATGGGDASADSGGVTCTPHVTCADLHATCGPIGDGCDGVIQCGTCTGDDVCGGGGTPSVCGRPACTKLTCADQNANCGAAADGCGGTIASCGTCDVDGEFCGGGGASRCGLGTVDDAGTGSDGGTQTCTPKTCTDVGANCGPVADGCGNLIPCGTCDTTKGESCGGAGTPSQCGKACKPITTCPTDLNCGPIADGCGGIISCGKCAAGEVCGGTTANVCASGTACTGLCTQQTTCPGGGTTSISGTVTSPNGALPIYGATVYIPNGIVQPFATGVACEQCATASGSPLVTTTTGADGKFLLSNVPVSSTAGGKTNNIPVVIQLGRWRKQFTVHTTSCTNTIAPAASTALPKNKTEGDIPLTAISTGYIDGLECVFRKLGIDDTEFTDPSGNGRIRFYQDNGAVITAPSGQCSISTDACTNYGHSCGLTCSGDGRSCNSGAGSNCGICQNSTSHTCTNIGGDCNHNRGKCIANGTCTDHGTCNSIGGTPPASSLYNDPNELAKYDMSIFECVGGQVDKTATQQANVRDYANSGGRVYATHFSYVWLYNAGAAPWNAAADWHAKQDDWNTAIATIDTSFAKGQAFAQWLNIVGGLNSPLPAGNPPWTPAPKITIKEARHDVDLPVSAKAQSWLYTTTADSPNKSSVQHLTFNTDYNKDPALQCGRVLFSDFHVSVTNSTNGVVFPNECDSNPLTTQEKVLAFMLFDLASCVTGGEAPVTCKPKTCAEQGIQCGQAGDGCGDVITCPDCTAGTTCGGGGQPNICGKPACTAKTCGANQCGSIADGCGSSVPCPACVAGTCGGSGTANVCGVGTCPPASCPTPAAGSACGPVANGCGALLDCACPANTPCINGKCGAPSCTPRTCAQAGANCGQIADGCGQLVNCGTCLAPQTCGAVTANICGGGIN